tara:strand:- start:34 stop:231 length:198 start_codon:yes stop_codon:yes gene_type:complete
MRPSGNLLGVFAFADLALADLAFADLALADLAFADLPLLLKGAPILTSFGLAFVVILPTQVDPFN